jgi:hypothetical protein
VCVIVRNGIVGVQSGTEWPRSPHVQLDDEAIRDGIALVDVVLLDTVW